MKQNPAKCVFGVSLQKILGFMVSQRGIEANLKKVKAILDVASPKNIKGGTKTNGTNRGLEQICL